jgi:3-oxoacyl-[acyl-carrier protein] reductase
MGGPLEGRAALVTGVSRRAGIGFAIARRLLTDGARVLVHSWAAFDHSQLRGADPGGMQGVLDELRAAGASLEHIEADFLEPGAPARVMARAVERFGHIDVLVANHAYGTRQPLEALTATEIDRHLLVNVRASLLLASEFAQQHRGGAGGRVILLTSGQHRGPMGGELAYAASKGALHQLTASLSDVLVARGITVNSVNPGPTDTGWAGPDEEAWVREHMPLGRWGEPDDAARLVAWLVSDEAAWVTGQIIDSEGGFRRHGTGV